MNRERKIELVEAVDLKHESKSHSGREIKTQPLRGGLTPKSLQAYADPATQLKFNAELKAFLEAKIYLVAEPLDDQESEEEDLFAIRMDLMNLMDNLIALSEELEIDEAQFQVDGGGLHHLQTRILSKDFHFKGNVAAEYGFYKDLKKHLEVILFCCYRRLAELKDSTLYKEAKPADKAAMIEKLQVGGRFIKAFIEEVHEVAGKCQAGLLCVNKYYYQLTQLSVEARVLHDLSIGLLEKISSKLADKHRIYLDRRGLGKHVYKLALRLGHELIGSIIPKPVDVDTYVIGDPAFAEIEKELRDWFEKEFFQHLHEEAFCHHLAEEKLHQTKQLYNSSLEAFIGDHEVDHALLLKELQPVILSGFVQVNEILLIRAEDGVVYVNPEYKTCDNAVLRLQFMGRARSYLSQHGYVEPCQLRGDSPIETLDKMIDAGQLCRFAEILNSEIKITAKEAAYVFQRAVARSSSESKTQIPIVEYWDENLIGQFLLKYFSINPTVLLSHLGQCSLETQRLILDKLMNLPDGSSEMKDEKGSDQRETELITFEEFFNAIRLRYDDDLFDLYDDDICEWLKFSENEENRVSLYLSIMHYFFEILQLLKASRLEVAIKNFRKFFSNLPYFPVCTISFFTEMGIFTSLYDIFLQKICDILPKNKALAVLGYIATIETNFSRLAIVADIAGDIPIDLSSMRSEVIPLFSIIWNGQYDLVEKFLRKGADLRVKDYQKRSCLMAAFGNHSLVFEYAEHESYCQIIQALLMSSMADRSFVNHKDVFGNTALYYAVQTTSFGFRPIERNQLLSFKMLISFLLYARELDYEKHATADLKSDDDSPRILINLLCLVQNKRYQEAYECLQKILEFLVEQEKLKCHLEGKPFGDKSKIIETYFVELLNIIIQQCNPDTRKDYFTWLSHNVVDNFHLLILLKFIFIDVNAVRNGDTPLRRALASGSAEQVQKFLHHGADVRIAFEGETSLMLSLRLIQRPDSGPQDPRFTFCPDDKPHNQSVAISLLLNPDNKPPIDFSREFDAKQQHVLCHAAKGKCTSEEFLKILKGVIECKMDEKVRTGVLVQAINELVTTRNEYWLEQLLSALPPFSQLFSTTDFKNISFMQFMLSTTEFNSSKIVYKKIMEAFKVLADSKEIKNLDEVLYYVSELLCFRTESYVPKDLLSWFTISKVRYQGAANRLMISLKNGRPVSDLSALLGVLDIPVFTVERIQRLLELSIARRLAAETGLGAGQIVVSPKVG